MKSSLSLTLIASLVGSALPVAAQDRTGSLAGPIARAATREAVRLAAFSQSAPVEADWARVRALVPETRIIVIVKGAALGARYLVRADESELVVAKQDPQLRLGTRQVETLARTNIMEIRVPRVSGHPKRTGALIGAGAGIVVGVISLAGCSKSEGVCAVRDTGTAMFAIIGAGIGAAMGAATSSDTTPYIIYRAP